MAEETNNRQLEVDEELSFLKPFWKILIIEVFLFSLTLLLGIFTALEISATLKEQNMAIPEISFWHFILQFLLTTLFVLLIIQLVKFRKQKGLIFKLIFVAAVFLGGISMMSVWFPYLPALFLMTIFLAWWWLWPSVFIQDLCIVLGISGAGSFLGLAFKPEIVVALLIVFSVYDVVAVYKTKHMVEMAKQMIESRAILGLIIPRSILGFQERLEELKPGGKFLILGGGDIVFPLFLCCSLVPSFGITKTLIVALFSVMGLLASFYFFAFQKRRNPIPALPPIAFFSILGYLAVKFVI